MAFSRNTKFFYDFTSDDLNNYRLWFIPGDVTALSTPATVAFPSFALNREFKGKSSLPDGMPYGQKETDTFKIKFNLSEFEDVGANDWTTVRDYIMNAKSPTEKTVNGEDIYIQNVWYLMSDNWDNDKVYDTPHFVGCQDKRPIKSVKSNTETGLVTFDIECLSIHRIINERLIMTDTTGVSGSAPSLPILHYLIAYAGGYAASLKNNIPNGATFILHTIANINTAWNTKANNLFSAMLRQTTVYGNTNTFLSHTTFYKETFISAHAQGSAIAEADLRLNGVITNTDDAAEVKGLLIASDDNSIVSSENLFDTIKEIANSQLCKVIPVMTDELTIDVKYLKVFDDIDSAKTLTAPDVLTTEIEINNSDKIIISSNSFIKNIGKVETDVADAYGKNDTFDMDIISYKKSGILSEDTDDAEIGIGTNTPLIAETELAYFQRVTSEPIVRIPYYLDSTTGFYMSVHDYVKIDLGGGVAYEPEAADITATPLLSTFNAYSRDGDLLQAIADRMQVSGFGFIRAKAAAETFGNDNVGLVTFEMPHEKATQNNVGENYIFTSGMFQKAGTYIDNVISNKAVLVEAEIDYITGKTKAKFFIRDDDGT